jgi:hypothetical protein
VRFAALILLAVGIAILADQFMHRSMLERITRQADQDPALAAAYMLEIAQTPDCPASDRSESGIAARALFTVESIATSRTEHALEWGAAWLSGALGLRAPDLSYGPGQIRPSTLLKLAATDDLPSPQRQALRQAALQPLTLFDECRALSLAAIVIRNMPTAPTATDALMPRGQLIAIAKDWNGQNNMEGADAVIAGLRYQRLVYEVFQRLRFETLRR